MNFNNTTIKQIIEFSKTQTNDCNAIVKKTGKNCKNKAKPNSDFCGIHLKNNINIIRKYFQTN